MRWLTVRAVVRLMKRMSVNLGRGMLPRKARAKGRYQRNEWCSRGQSVPMAHAVGLGSKILTCT